MKNIIKKYLESAVAILIAVCIFTIGYLIFRNAIPDKEKVIQVIYNKISEDNYRKYDLENAKLKRVILLSTRQYSMTKQYKLRTADNKGHVFYEASFPIDDPFEESRKVLYDIKIGEIVGYGVLE